MSHSQKDFRKIDIVYTWVDGSDPVWRKKRQEALEKIGDISDLEKHGNVEGRFRNNGELKYSLRSLEKYFPEHGDIYIVTDNQVPDFLKEHKDIKIVFHQDFMKPESLPTFSSKNIESQLPQIQELSEIFFSFNDDFFLGPNFQIEDMYNEKPIYYFIDKEDSPIQFLNSYPGSKVLSEKFSDYISTQSYPAPHSPKVIVKKDFFIFQSLFCEYFSFGEKEVFRTKNYPALLTDVYPRYMLYSDKGVLGTKKDRYIESSDVDYESLLRDFQNVPFFCINDTGDNIDNTDTALLKISEVLEKLFPEKSKYEK